MAPLVVTAGIIYQGGRVLVTQRKASVPYPHLWEFPGGKVEPGEDPRSAVVRELKEELAIHTEVIRVYDVIFYRYPERDVLLIAFECKWLSGELQELDVAAHRWVAAEDLISLQFLPADVQLVEQLQAKARL